MSKFNIAFVYDNSVKQEYINLTNYHLKNDFWNSLTGTHNKHKKRNDGMTLHGLIGKTGMIAKSTPARDGFNHTQKKNFRNIKPKCILCQQINNPNIVYPLTLMRLLLWRGYFIIPNVFPYFKHHYLIMSSNHNEGKVKELGNQNMTHQNNQVITDMIDFYKLIEYDGSIFFNGMAGNSQDHFHYHHIKEELPIQKYLELESNLTIEKYTSKNNTDIVLFSNNDTNCLNGIVFSGENLAKTIFSFLKGISSEFQYNIIIYHSNNQTKVVVFVRKMPKNGRILYNISASILAGVFNRVKMPMDQLKSGKLEQTIEKLCQQTVEKLDKKMLVKLNLI